MELEKVAAVLRPRRHWEAIDLGFFMARRWWRQIYFSWFAAVTPVYLLLLAIFHDNPLWSVAALWWLKPFFDRLPLFVLSRGLFGDAPTIGSTLKAVPRLWLRRLASGALFDRLLLSRGFALPVAELERARGWRRITRTGTLLRACRHESHLFTVVSLVFELTVFIGVFGLAGFLFPELLDDLSYVFDDGSLTSGGGLLISTAYFFAVSFIEPLYVAGGFSLYLNRRTHLEGWDIELAFRRLARRLEGGAIGALRASICLAVVLLATSAPAQAQAVGVVVQDSVQDPQRVIDEILQQPEFGTRRTVKRLLPVDGSETRERSFVGAGIAAIVEPLLWMLAITALAFLAVYGFRRFSLRSQGEKGPATPQTLFGLSIDPQTLPEDVPGTAWQLWNQGQQADALSLLYRGALAVLVHRDGLEVKRSDTEGDCVRIVQAEANRKTAQFFAALTASWQQQAYSGRPVTGAAVRSLCSQWSDHLGGAT